MLIAHEVCQDYKKIPNACYSKYHQNNQQVTGSKAQIGYYFVILLMPFAGTKMACPFAISHSSVEYLC